jgi:hypothetical protein
MVRDMEKRFVDASQRAEVRFSNGSSPIECLTLQEAIIAFGKLSPEEKKTAMVVADDGQRFGAEDVDSLHYK